MLNGRNEMHMIEMRRLRRTAVEKVLESLEPRRLFSSLSQFAAFNSTNGLAPQSNLVVDANGDLFGTASQGGADGNGDVFEIASGGSTITPLASFNVGNGKTPGGTLVIDASGNLYGTTSSGGASGDGTVFEITAASILADDPTITPLVSFDGADGDSPQGLAIDSQRNLYGATNSGGADNDGTVFEITAASIQSGSPAITPLGTFTGANGNTPGPQSSLVVDSNGNVFGTTETGGANNLGEVFEVTASSINAAAPSIAPLVSFAGLNGDNPDGGLAIDSQGDLFGTTQMGGLHYSTNYLGSGSVFEITAAGIAAGTPTITTLADTFLNNDDESDPTGSIALDASGNIYGTAGIVGGTTDGLVYEVPAGGGAVATVGIFDMSGAEGSNPLGGVVLDNGAIYGAAQSGGTNNDGDVFQVAPPHLAFVQQPTDAASSSVISPAVTVQVEDSSGNVISSDDSNVTISVASGPGFLGGTLTVAAVDGVATFSDLSLQVAGTYTLQATDNSDDSVAATSSAFTISPGASAKLVIAQQPSNVFENTPDAPPVVVDVEDLGGNIVTSDTSTVTLGFQTGPTGGTVGGTASVAAVNGVATFNGVTFSPAGAYTLAVTDGSLSSVVTSSFTVSAPPAELGIATQPADSTAGAPLSVTVNLEDSSGNVITVATSDVTLSIKKGPAGAVLNGTATVASVNGVATFSGLSLDTVGTYKLLATDAADGGITAKTVLFTISPGAPAEFTFVHQPNNVTAGQRFTPRVWVMMTDAFGNIITGKNVKVRIASGPSGAVLGGTLVQVSDSNGIGHFPNLILTQAGTYTLTGTHGTLTGVASNSFTVTAAAAAQVAFIQQPMPVTVSAAITPPIVVDVEDQFGNPVFTDDSDVTLVIKPNTNTTGAILEGTLTVAAQDGAATFSDISLTAAGSYKLKAKDGILAKAKSARFTVSAAS
jgi:uncharacterized repeat protein (TIGR03803 family)